MSLQHTVLRQYRDRSSTVLQQNESVTGNAENNFDQLVPIAANTHYVMAFTRANLQSLCLYAADAVTIYTNNPSGSAPQDTIPLVAGQCLVWTLATDGLSKCPFSGNVTSIYITNSTAAAVAVSIRSLENQ